MIVIASDWPKVAAGMFLPVYVIFLLAKRKWKRRERAIERRGFGSMVFFYLRFFRWHLLCCVLAFAASLAFAVGVHRLFVAVESDDRELTLIYTWPRADVRLKWSEIGDARLETRKFGVFGRTMTRLAITSTGEDYLSPWCGDDDALHRAYNIIQTQSPHLK